MFLVPRTAGTRLNGEEVIDQIGKPRKLGKGSGVSPGAIVHKNVPPFKLAFAPPARIIKSTPPERGGEKG